MEHNETNVWVAFPCKSYSLKNSYLLIYVYVHVCICMYLSSQICMHGWRNLIWHFW